MNEQETLLDRLERARLALRSIDEDELEDAVLDAMDYITGHTVKQAIAAIEKSRNDPNTEWTPIKRADLKRGPHKIIPDDMTDQEMEAFCDTLDQI